MKILICNDKKWVFQSKISATVNTRWIALRTQQSLVLPSRIAPIELFVALKSRCPPLYKLAILLLEYLETLVGVYDENKSLVLKNDELYCKNLELQSYIDEFKKVKEAEPNESFHFQDTVVEQN